MSSISNYNPTFPDYLESESLFSKFYQTFASWYCGGRVYKVVLLNGEYSKQYDDDKIAYVAAIAMNVMRVVLFPLTFLCIALKLVYSEDPKPVNSPSNNSPTGTSGPSTITPPTELNPQTPPEPVIKKFSLVQVLSLWEDYYAKVMNDLKSIEPKGLDAEGKKLLEVLSLLAEKFTIEPNQLKNSFFNILSSLALIIKEPPLNPQEKNVEDWEKILEHAQIWQFQKLREVQQLQKVLDEKEKGLVNKKSDVTQSGDHQRENNDLTNKLNEATNKLKDLIDNFNKLINHYNKQISQVNERLELIEKFLAMLPNREKNLDILAKGVSTLQKYRK